MAGLSTLSYQESLNYGWTAAVNLTGSGYQPNANPTTYPTKRITLSTALANNVAGGGNELYSALTNIAANSTTSIDVTSVTEILQSTTNFARVKSIKVQLLSTTDDTVFGTNATSVTIDGSVANALLSTNNAGWLSTNTAKFDIANGDYVSWGTTGAKGIVVSSTNKVIKIVNNDVTNIAAVVVTIAGGTS